jgi:hypothetical protein
MQTGTREDQRIELYDADRDVLLQPRDASAYAAASDFVVGDARGLLVDEYAYCNGNSAPMWAAYVRFQPRSRLRTKCCSLTAREATSRSSHPRAAMRCDRAA